MLFVTMILVACNSSEVSIREIESIPNKVQDVINDDNPVQLINVGEKDAYIIFQSTGTVTDDVEVIENILTIKLDRTNEENGELKQYAYKLTGGIATYDAIQVLVNGEETPIARVVGIN